MTNFRKNCMLRQLCNFKKITYISTYYRDFDKLDLTDRS